MQTNEMLFLAFLNQYEPAAWQRALDELLPSIHEVDRNATRVWFAFYPLALANAIAEADNPDKLADDLLLMGQYSLLNQIDSSHSFLYGHRYWPQVKDAIVNHAAGGQTAALDLASHIREIADKVAHALSIDSSLVIGITAAGLMTLRQVGAEAFKQFPGRVESKTTASTPEKVLKRRAKDDSQGLFGFLRGPAKVFSVTFDEHDADASFKLINTQHITTAAAADKRNYHLRDSRCTRGEGPIPVQCRAASCGTCWIGILGGAEKLSNVGALESRRIKEFGYIDTDEPQPLIRLACQAQAFGAVSIVIPPWNGVFGRLLKSKSSKTEAQRI